MNRPQKIVRFNAMQMVCELVRVPILAVEAGRGCGKSTMLARKIMKCVSTMPRSKGALVGSTFRGMLAETLPSTVEALERLGWYKDVHFYVGKRSPMKWAEPYQPPLEWSNAIHFWNGTVLMLVSQDKSSVERRGQNFDWVIADEAAMLDEKRLFNEVLAGKRTFRRQFVGNPHYLSETYTSSTPVTRAGQWFLKFEDKALDDPGKYAFISAPSRVNAENLSPTWFEEMRKAAPSQMIYDAEIENIRPRLTVNGFYPMIRPSDKDGKPSHYYSSQDGDVYLKQHIASGRITASSTADMDCLRDLPLIGSFDPGAAINAWVMMQLHKQQRELRCLKNFWRLSPSIIQDLVSHDIIPYYKDHRHKHIDLWYDRTANNRSANSRTTIAEDVADLWRRAGWTVRLMSRGSRVITQDERFHVTSKAMAEDDPRLYKVRINKDNCRDLIIALENAEARENSKGLVEKVKLSERRAASVPRQHAIDLTDAFDLPVHHYTKEAIEGSAPFVDVMVR